MKARRASSSAAQVSSNLVMAFSLMSAVARVAPGRRAAVAAQGAVGRDLVPRQKRRHFEVRRKLGRAKFGLDPGRLRRQRRECLGIDGALREGCVKGGLGMDETPAQRPRGSVHPFEYFPDGRTLRLRQLQLVGGFEHMGGDRKSTRLNSSTPENL